MRKFLENKNTSHFNTFQVFEDIYNNKKNTRYDQLEMPDFEPRKRNFINFLIAFLVVILFAVGLHPILSYTLKTPYPLVIIGEETVGPALKKNDLVIVAGVINSDSIRPNDVIVYQSKNSSLSVNRVVALKENQIVVRSDAASREKIISPEQVVGRVISPKIPLLGKISNLITGK